MGGAARPAWLLLWVSLLPAALNGPLLVSGGPTSSGGSSVSWRQLLADLRPLSYIGRQSLYSRNARMYGRQTRLMGSEFLGKRSSPSPSPSLSAPAPAPARHLGDSHHHQHQQQLQRGVHHLRRRRSLGSEFLGKRAASDAEFLMRPLTDAQYLDEKMSQSPFLEKRVPESEYIGEEAPDMTSLDKEAADWDWLSKRVPGSEFLGKRMPGSEFLGKRIPGSEFLGKRFAGSEFLGKRRLGSEFLGKRSSGESSAYGQYPYKSLVNLEFDKPSSGFSHHLEGRAQPNLGGGVWSKFYHYRSNLRKRHAVPNWSTLLRHD